MTTATVTLSSKYQIVIPRALRKRLQLKPGQKIRLNEKPNGDIIIQTKSALDEFKGKYKGVWGKDPVAYIRKQRDEWDD